MLQLAGVNVKLFKTHSTRSASTSAAHKTGVAVNTILKSGMDKWVYIQNYFYNRPVTVQDYNENYSVRLLRGQKDKWCHSVL